MTCAVTHKQEYFPKKTQLPLLRKPLDRELESAVARFRNRTIFFQSNDCRYCWGVRNSEVSARRELTIDPTLVVRFRKLSTFLWPALLRHPRVTATSPVKKTFEHLRFFKLHSVDPLSLCSVDKKLRLGKSELFSTL